MTKNPKQTGTLFLLPVGLATPGDTPTTWQDWLPTATHDTACRLDRFIVENAKTARLHLKALGHPKPLRDLNIEELPTQDQLQSDATAHDRLLAPLIAGNDVGLMSEAGCPAIADPGATLVRQAHLLGIPVRPMVGPSSLLLALMASGLDGQRFAFHGYVPARESERMQTLQKLDRESAKLKQTQLFIETPYRNLALFQALLQHCQGATRLCIASDISLPSESIITDTIKGWQKRPTPDISKRPTVFLLLSGA